MWIIESAGMSFHTLIDCARLLYKLQYFALRLAYYINRECFSGTIINLSGEICYLIVLNSVLKYEHILLCAMT